jgi:hypothetical protein
MREGILKVGEYRREEIWRVSKGSQQASFGFELDATNLVCPWIRLMYRNCDSGEVMDYRIHLDTTDPNFDGWRFWFLCPLTVGARMCGKRVAKLYLPPGARYFGCRHCHDLTYLSCQRSDKRISRLRRNPDLLDAIIRRPELFSPSHLLLASKAVERLPFL